MDSSSIVSILAAVGFGSLLSTCVQFFLINSSEMKARSFEERKKAYIGLLEAYHKAGVEKTDTAGEDFAYWQRRCELVAPLKVLTAIQNIVASNDDIDSRAIADKRLQDVLRSDLGVAKYRKGWGCGLKAAVKPS